MNKKSNDLDKKEPEKKNGAEEIECPDCLPEPLAVKTGVNAGKAAL